MNQTDADQKNTTAVIDELAAAMGRPLTDIEKLSVTAAMYQHQRDDLLAACEKLLAYRQRTGAINFQLEKADDYFRLVESAIAAAKGETNGNR